MSSHVEQGFSSLSGDHRLVNSSIFWNGMTSEDFLHEIEKAESELKLYIYPIPKEAQLVDKGKIPLSHFRSE